MERKKPGPPRGQKHTEVKRSAFGERLFRARKARGLSQEELGQKVRLSKRMISRYEGTYSGPSLEVLEEIAQALKVTASYLIGESVHKKNENEIKHPYRMHINTIQALSPKNQKKVFEYAELLAASDNNQRGAISFDILFNLYLFVAGTITAISALPLGSAVSAYLDGNATSETVKITGFLPFLCIISTIFFGIMIATSIRNSPALFVALWKKIFKR